MATTPLDVMLNGVRYLADVMPRLFCKARFFDCCLSRTSFC
jgi:hypothetical protein